MSDLLRRHRLLVVSGALALAVAAALGLALFQPWKLWVDQSVDEAAPVVASDPAVDSGERSARSDRPDGSAGPTGSAGSTGPQELFSTNEWNSVSHGQTTGKVKVYRLANGDRVLRLENLKTSNGPDLRVMLSKGGYETQHDLGPDRLELGRLKGNKGSSNYTVKPGTDLNEYRSVVVWCKRFDAVFAAAPIRA
ncbi:DM13 domain-containing protein [Actinomadura fulvescens]|uniref:DM13 domain-containing protein n=1 Tax=Actinomadura fulvescens TaxID=46160 RepID=A0ABP6BQG5_9ACTN